MRYSLVNRSGHLCPAAVGSPGPRAESGLKLILDLAAQQRLRSLPHAHLSADGKPGREKRERSSVRLSHLPIPGVLISLGKLRNGVITGGTERSGLAFWDRSRRPDRWGHGRSGKLDW